MTKNERITAYLAHIPGAISGSGGHDQTFKVACALYNGWCLTEEETFSWLALYNQKCQPRWNERELKHKAASAAKAMHEKRRGYLFDDNSEPKSTQGEPTTIFKVKPRLSDDQDDLKRYSYQVSTSTLSPSVTRREQKRASESSASTTYNSKSELVGLLSQLRALKNDGAIHDMADAEFYASLIKAFDATYTGAVGAEDHPVDHVPEPPPGTSSEERMEFYAADLEQAIGAEYIDHDYQPPALRAPNSFRQKRRKT
jgi:hypothetical protein